MDALLERFLTRVGIKDLKPYETGSFNKLLNDASNNTIIAEILFDTYLNYKEYLDLLNTIHSFVLSGGFEIRLSFAYSKKDNQNKIKEIISSFIKSPYKDDIYSSIEENEYTELNNFFFDDKRIIFLYKDASLAYKANEECKKLQRFFEIINIDYTLMTQEEVYEDNFAEIRDKKYQEDSEKASKEFKEKEIIASTYQPCKLKDIEIYPKVLVTGKVFKVEKRTTKNDKNLFIIEFGDDSSSISMTIFESKKMPMETLEKINNGTKIKVQGRPYHDAYNRNELSLRCDSLEFLEPDKEREDDSEEKRVELHVHTKFSAYDGVDNVVDYIKRASKWGHKAIAITDHGVCQAFPEAQMEGQKDKIKILYGTELYVVDDEPKYIYNSSDRVLKDAEYVVFDLETTGLSAKYDRIIEFGAVKLNKQGQVIDYVDFFIDPERKLSRFSIENSHISQDDVDHGKKILPALKEILEFFQDCILISHNAAFDYGFLNEALKNNNLPPIKNPVIDTLPLSRYLFPNKRSHSEEAIARYYDVAFDATSAHRANYDASILATIFHDFMLDDLCKNNRELKHSDLALLKEDIEGVKRHHPYHVIALAKDELGLKDLYKIISASYINYQFAGTPLIPKSYLKNMREHLLLGSACLNGEVFENAMTKSSEVLEEAISFYDYIEVQPPANYLYLINKGSLSSEEEIKKIIQDIIVASKNQGKTVCATGDVHYIDPEDKIYRDVLIACVGLKGSRHPLNLAPLDSASEEKKKEYYRNPYKNPDQHFRTTKEMLEAFSFLNDDKLIHEIVIENTNKIADMIDDITPMKSGLFTPKIEGADKLLTDYVYNQAHSLYGEKLPPLIEDRLKNELKGIIDNGYAVIYWISSLLVRWSNDRGYLIGSRGSVGSSFVATMANITEVNPLPPHYRCPKCKKVIFMNPNEIGSGIDLEEKTCPDCGTKMIGDGQNIPFSIFLGFHAEKVPDIDLNFPSDFQSEAQNYLKVLLGEKNVFKAGTIQTIQDKNARHIALEYFESLGIEKSKIRTSELDRYSSKCVGVKRTTGQHPGGVVVVPDDMEVYDFTPIQYPPETDKNEDNKWFCTHYDFEKLHDNILKFDMLGHKDPEAIKMMCDLCNISFKELKDKVPLNDKEALSLFWSTEALKLKENVLKQQVGVLGLPEFGTTIGRDILLKTHPHSFGDLVKISGLAHGTNVFKGNAEDLILKDNYTLNDVITCRDDILNTLSEKYGVDALEAFQLMELVRKGKFGKVKPEVKEHYISLLKENKVPDYYIESLQKVQYLYPRAHAVAYVSMAVRCAYFKVHHPLEYYAVYFTKRCDKLDIVTMMKGIKACKQMVDLIYDRKIDADNKLNALEQTIEMYDRGYKFAPIDINKSDAINFTIDYTKNMIIPPLSAIDGIGAVLASNIVKARKDIPFQSVSDLINRVHLGEKTISVFKEMHVLDSIPESEQMTLF